MMKDIIFALELGMKVISVFIISLFLGYRLDIYLNTQPLCTMIGVIIAFVCVMKLLLGAGKHE